ncbi:MAG: DUF427 domain-containing protein [Pseudomonadota bacterium]
MADHIKIRRSDATWSVRVGGAVIGESSNALALAEGSYPEVIYFPREDIATAFLDASSKSTHCPHKGDASYFDIVTKSATLKDAVWSYEAPFDGVSDIAGYLAFGHADVTVEKI